MNFKKILQNRIKKLYRKQELVKVYSHPRSGTHFLEAFVGRNFYKERNLLIKPITWGHWSNRRELAEGNPYGKLFGNHYFAERNINDRPKIYIIRDVRAVALSIWKTSNFVHQSNAGRSFAEFLRDNIDWSGTPAIESEPILNIIEHWCLHVKSWLELEKTDNNLLIVRYEDLIDEPYKQYKRMRSKFFKWQWKKNSRGIDPIQKPLGLLPNKGTKDAWEEFFTQDDLLFCDKIVRRYGLQQYLT